MAAATMETMRYINYHRESQLLRPVRDAVEGAAANGQISLTETRHIAEQALPSLIRSQDPHRQLFHIAFDIAHSGARVHPRADLVLAKRTMRTANRRELVLQFRETKKYTRSQASRLADRAMVAFDKACAAHGLDPARSQVHLVEDRGHPPTDATKGKRDFKLHVSGETLPNAKSSGASDPNRIYVRVKAADTRARDEIEFEARPRW